MSTNGPPVNGATVIVILREVEAAEVEADEAEAVVAADGNLVPLVCASLTAEGTAAALSLLSAMMAYEDPLLVLASLFTAVRTCVCVAPLCLSGCSPHRYFTQASLSLLLLLLSKIESGWPPAAAEPVWHATKPSMEKYTQRGRQR